MNEFIFENLRDEASFYFSVPVGEILCNDSVELDAVFSRIDEELSCGHYLAGYFTYECGVALATGNRISNIPLVNLTVFKKMQPGRTEFGAEENVQLTPLEPVISKDEYIESVNKIRAAIGAGIVYQVNYTFQQAFTFSPPDAPLFYRQLKNKSSVRYAACYQSGNESVISLSPELFFEKIKSVITVKPMKGTMPRGRVNEEDETNAILLNRDPKNRAENGMIVDLLRNDLGRIAVPGSVKVTELFKIEKYETLLQMISTVTGELKPEVSWKEIFKSLFPSGSVTGAPKLSAIEQIAALEKSPRGVYTGATGFFTPEGNALFNVSIRTVVTGGEKTTAGVGSGIVWDSDPEKEYEESLLKGSYIFRNDFSLIETLLLKNGKLRMLSRHLARMEDSAKYFIFKFNQDMILNRINEFVRLHSNQTLRVRFLLSRHGEFRIESVPFVKNSSGLVMLSGRIIDQTNPAFYHKTTDRRMYDSEFEKARQAGLADVLFVNQDGFLTEGCISNVFLKIRGEWRTPHWQSGLLRGVLRGYLLGKYKKIREEFVTVKDLESAEEIFICNSLRGITRVQLQRDKK